VVGGTMVSASFSLPSISPFPLFHFLTLSFLPSPLSPVEVAPSLFLPSPLPPLRSPVPILPFPSLFYSSPFPLRSRLP